MPVKKNKKHYREQGNYKRSKRFMKVYAPYLPLILLIGLGFVIGRQPEFDHNPSKVLSYATDISRSSLLEKSNQMRLDNNETELKPNIRLNSAAQAKADDMAKKDYWSHNTPDGKEPWYFINQHHYDFYKAGENLAYGFGSSAGTIAGWMNSPEHRANLLDKDYKDVGFGIANAPDYQSKGPQTIVVAMYGLTADDSLPLLAKRNSSSQPLVQAASATDVSLVDTLSKNGAIISLVAGLIVGGAIMFLVIKHAFAIRKLILHSEKYILKHPLLDTTLIAAIVVGFILLSKTGTIL